MNSLDFDPDRYPRTYRPWRLLTVFWSVLAGLLGLAAFTMFIGTLRDPDWANPLPTLGRMALSLGLVALLIGGLVLLWRRRIVLAPTAIELRGLRLRRVLRSDIESVLRRGTSVKAYELRVRNQPQPLRFSFTFKEDDLFLGWFAGLPDTNRIELARATVDIAADEALGATPEARLEAAARARRVTQRLTIVAGVATIWTVFHPDPRAPLLVLAVAWVPIALLICALSRGRYLLTARRNSGRGELSMLLVASTVSLCARAWMDVRPVNAAEPVVASIVAGIALLLACLAVSRDIRPSGGTLAWLAILLSFDAAGALALANGEFDRSEGTSQVVTVVGAKKTGTRYPDYYLTLSQVPADVDSAAIQVPAALYRRHLVGDQVCLRERDGALGWHWLRIGDVAACRAP